MGDLPLNTSAVRRCCHLAMFVQAMAVNLTPLFFIPLRTEFGLTFEQLGRLVLINFFSQMLTDVVCTAMVDRVGRVKLLIVTAHLAAALGLLLFAGASLLFPLNPYSGLVLGTIFFSIGCGLLEVLISPIINALPSQKREADMAMLHAFYPIGKVVVIAITSLIFLFMPPTFWRWITVGWAAIPLVNCLAFLWITLPPFVPERERERLRVLLCKPVFWALLGGMFMAGAAEVTFAQWISAFAQAGLGFSQQTANWIGFGFFSLMMVFGRLAFGLYGHGRYLIPLLSLSALLSAAAYFLVGLSTSPVLSLIICIGSGLFVSMLWPGLVSLGADRFPKAGISFFALFAVFGDAGAGAVPWTVGLIADQISLHFEKIVAAAGEVSLAASWVDLPAEQVGLRVALFFAGFFPLILFFLLRFLQSTNSKPRGH